MDLTICQSCKKVFDQTQRLPKVLSCGCMHCTKCLQKFSQATDKINCKTHLKLISIEENNVKDFRIQDYFMQEMNKFEQQSNLKQVIQELSSQASVHKSKVISIIKECEQFQKVFSSIVRQVTQIFYQKELFGCQKIVVQIEQVLKKIRVIDMKYKQIKSMVTGQQSNNNIIELNNLVKEFQGMQTEVQRVRALKYQGSSLDYRIIQEVSFKVFQELMGMSVEQGALIQDFSVMINKYIEQQNQIQNQPVPLPWSEQLDFRIESIQHLQNILSEFQTQQLDVSSILNSPLNTISICKKQMILYDLIQLKSEKDQQNLLQILNLSKNQPKIQQATANSLTMLNYMNFQFTNIDLSNLDLSKSDLSDTTFTNCNFSNSNLTQANLRNSKFLNCNLSNSNLTSIITEYPHIYSGHTRCVTAVAISRDSEFIVSGSRDKSIILWNIKTGTSKTMIGHTNDVHSVSISSDNKFIVSGSYDESIILWDVKTGKSKTMSGHTRCVTAVAISRDSEFIVSGSEDNTIILWNIKTGTSKTMSGHTNTVYAVAISTDSEFIVSGSADCTIRLWNTKSQQCIKVLKGHTLPVTSVSISNDQQYIVSGSADKTIILWSTKSQECIKVLNGHSNTVLSVIFSFDSKYIISGSKDKTIRVWSVQSGEQLCEINNCGYAGSLSLSEDNNWLVSSTGH